MSFPWVRACYSCGRLIYWDEESLTWCHLMYDNFKITHTAHVAFRSHPFEPLLVIQEEP